MRKSSGECVEHYQADQNRYQDDHKSKRFPPESYDCKRHSYDDEVLDGAKWHVEQQGCVLVKPKSVQNQGPKCVSHLRAKIITKRHRDEEIRLDVKKGL